MKLPLEIYAQPTAEAVALLAEQILQKKGRRVVLVSWLVLEFPSEFY